jgi:hypothetical protein
LRTIKAPLRKKFEMAPIAAALLDFGDKSFLI